jgi:hypothetical protein
MWAAIRLRLLEAQRRGAPWLLLIACVAVFWVARAGGETADGRYGLATDLAAALTYVAALFYGAFPLSIDRERRRSYLPSASPVSPPVWAVGNALAAVLLTFTAGMAVFGCAALGCASSGGIETHAIAPLNQTGLFWVPPDNTLRIGVSEEAHAVRLVTRSVLRVEDRIGTAEAPTLEVDGESFLAYAGQPMMVPASAPAIHLRNASPEFALAIVGEEVWALEESRSFVLNGLAAGVPPTLGAAAVAAFAVAAGACLSAPVAALLAAVLLAISAMSSFLLDTYTYGGSTAAAHEDHGHHHHGPAPGEADLALRSTARAMMRPILGALPDLASLDRTDRVALGEWTGLQQGKRALLLLAGALVLAALIGGLGVWTRRLP